LGREPEPSVQELLDEQLRYYRARASTYLTETLVPLARAGHAPMRRDLAAAFDTHCTGDVLELACGAGTWTSALAQRADRVTAVDASPEMLQVARDSAPGANVRFERLDLFQWRPARRYDAIFMGFFLSHVPDERFAALWDAIGHALAPDGHVVLVDDAVRKPDELIYGPDSPIIQRHSPQGDAYRIYKVDRTAASLEQQLGGLGWDFDMSRDGVFFWGVGTPAQDSPS
jgi:demethylmenaquinone methyltransferase/2-methoxy-6-polyprenyl-1,4-benzoquinol methylase